MSTKSLLFLNTADSTIGDVFVWLNSIGINIKKRLEPSLIILNLKYVLGALTDDLTKTVTVVTSLRS